MLVGVNDVWHEFKPSSNGVDADKFYKIYDMLITEIKEEFLDVKIMILEPFVLKAHGTEENWDVFRPEVEKRAEMASKIAKKYNLPFVPLQKGFGNLSEKTGANYWLEDGVHPTPMGHEYIKNEWIERLKSCK